MQILWFLIIGGVAGFLAGLVMKGRGMGILANVIVGIVGAVLGGYLFGLLGLTAGRREAPRRPRDGPGEPARPGGLRGRPGVA